MKKAQYSTGFQTHDLSVMRHVLYRCAQLLPHLSCSTAREGKKIAQYLAGFEPTSSTAVLQPLPKISASYYRLFAYFL